MGIQNSSRLSFGKRRLRQFCSRPAGRDNSQVSRTDLMWISWERWLGDLFGNARYSLPSKPIKPTFPIRIQVIRL